MNPPSTVILLSAKGKQHKEKKYGYVQINCLSGTCSQRSCTTSPCGYTFCAQR